MRSKNIGKKEEHVFNQFFMPIAIQSHEKTGLKREEQDSKHSINKNDAFKSKEV